VLIIALVLLTATLILIGVVMSLLRRWVRRSLARKRAADAFD
jgi:hypothetical protein